MMLVKFTRYQGSIIGAVETTIYINPTRVDVLRSTSEENFTEIVLGEISCTVKGDIDSVAKQLMV